MPISTYLYLDTRARQKKDEYPIKLAISIGRRVSYLSTGIFVPPTNWKEHRVVGRKDQSKLNGYLLSFHAHVKDLINDGFSSGRYFGRSPSQVKEDISDILNGGSGVKSSFLKLFDDFADNRKSERTKEIYRVTGRKIRQMYPRAHLITIDAINLDWLEDFEEKLVARGNNSSTRSIDLRNIRAVVRNAYRHKLIKENPFDEFLIPKGESRSRALTIDELRTFVRAQLHPWEGKYRDFFLLSFFLIGMNTEDLLHLTKENVVEDRVIYKRSKTGKEINVKIEKEASALLKKYRGEQYLLNVLDSYSSTHNWTAKVDSVLKTIAYRLNLPPLTMYWARHTWATIAHGDLGISLSVVSDALGHSVDARRVTMTYIHRRCHGAVDAANRDVIDFLYSI